MRRIAKFATLVFASIAFLSNSAFADDEIIWQNRNGQVHYWHIIKGKRIGGFDVGGQVSLDWCPLGVGDINHDGFDDIVWQHNSGQLHYWPIENGARVDGLNVGKPDMLLSARALPLGLGDMNGDGTKDILVWLQHYQERLGYLKLVEGQPQGIVELGDLPVSATVRCRKFRVGNKGYRQKNVVLGDITGNRIDDLIFGSLGWGFKPVSENDQSLVAGQLIYWDTKTREFKEILANSMPDSNWFVVGAGDLDGDGFDEIVWKKKNGHLRYWVVREGVVKYEADIAAAGPVNDDEWQVIGIGDLTGDGLPTKSSPTAMQERDGVSPPPIRGQIGEKYATLGGQNGALGQPMKTEAVAPHGGRCQAFKHGSICWHPQIGEAFAVWGSIHDKWVQIGRAEFGYPITDERVTTDGRGRFNHFRGMQYPNRPESSIYWTAQTGAHAIYGAIRDAWAQQGWERGPLGYPTGDEHQDGKYRRVNFEHGYIRWAGDTGIEIGR